MFRFIRKVSRKPTTRKQQMHPAPLHENKYDKKNTGQPQQTNRLK